MPNFAGAMVGLGEGITVGGKALADYFAKSGLQEEFGRIQAERDRVLQGYHRENQQFASDLAEGVAMRAEQRRPANIIQEGAAQTHVDVEREQATRPGVIARAQETARVNAEAPLQAKVAFGDRLIELATKEAKAKNDQDRQAFIEAMSDPRFVNGLKAEARAKHVDSPATLAQARLAQFQLEQAQELAGLQKGIAAAEAAGPSGADAAKRYRAEIDAKGFTGKWQNMAPLLTAGTALMRAAENEMDTGTKAAMQAQASELFKQAGINAPSSLYKEGDEIRDKKTGKVFVVKDGVPVPKEEIRERPAPGAFDKEFPASRGIIGQRVGAATPQPEQSTQGTQPAASSDYSNRVSLQRGRWVVNIPYRLPGGQNLSDKRFDTKEEAIEAIRQAMRE